MSNTVEQQAPLRITISEVKGLLDQGKSRKEIADHYGKSMAEMQRMVWSNPKLKNLKAKKQYTGVELVDDEEETPVAEVNAIDNAVDQGPVAEEVAHVPGPEAVQAFENQEEMGTQEEAPVTTEAVEETWR
jgi:hypothetical protein